MQETYAGYELFLRATGKGVNLFFYGCLWFENTRKICFWRCGPGSSETYDWSIVNNKLMKGICGIEGCV